jgi:multiple sugar transport system permease protein
MISKMNHPAWFLVPYWTLFLCFVVVPVLAAFYLSFTYFNVIETPTFIGITNYIELITMDTVFMQYVLPNTLKFALIVGPIGYFLSFILAWMLAQIPAKARTVLAIILYSPSLTMGVALSSMWRIIFSDDSQGYVNSLLLNWGLI